MDNTWPCVVSLYGTLLAGGVFCIVNPQTKADKLEFILNDSGARILLTDGHLAKEFMPALPQVRQPLAVIASGKLPAEAVSIEAFDEVAQHSARRRGWRHHSARSFGTHLYIRLHGQSQGRHARTSPWCSPPAAS